MLRLHRTRCCWQSKSYGMSCPTLMLHNVSRDLNDSRRVLKSHESNLITLKDSSNVFVVVDVRLHGRRKMVLKTSGTRVSRGRQLGHTNPLLLRQTTQP